ncbi:Pkinase-domain-containing protein, partial [Schizopora paradoxa]
IARFYAAELVTGVYFLHHHGIIHRDLKPENLLINRDGHLVISDFGLAHDVSSGCPTMYAGTPGYVAPEMHLHKRYSFEVDMWSVGCIVYEMMYG